MKKFLFISILCFMFSLHSSYAQRGWEVGGWLGASHYFGDLNTKFDLSHPGLGGGAIARYNFNSRISMKFGLNYGHIWADDAKSRNVFERRRNLSFNSDIYEVQWGGEFNFMPLVHGSRDKYFTPYVHAGITVFNFNPRTKYEGKWYNLQELGTEGQFKNDEYTLTQLAFHYGVGIKWDITQTWSLNFDISARKLFTDYLDDVSGVYPEMDDLETLRGDIAVVLSDRSIPDTEGVKLGEPGKQRGDLWSSDIFSFTSIGIVYYIGKVYCPEFYR